jgi:leader peptidase (prepilin peptidase)/N-methyltransferase
VSLTEFPPDFLRICAVLMGLVWGSFLNVVIYRVPREMSVSRPPSHCPACGERIPWYRNIPVISWLLMRGRAACCGAKVSPRYVLVELAGGVLSLAVLELLVLPLPAATTALHGLMVYIANFALALGLMAATFIDLEHMIVPDRISIGGTVLGVATFGFRDMQLSESLIGAVVGFVIVWLPFGVIYPRLRGRVGMGLGDAKLTMLAGAWFGWPGALFALGAGAIQGTIAYVVLMLSGHQLEEPEAVKREREELRAELEKLSEEERAELEAELGDDPLAEEAAEGWGQARIAFGPFIILATLECLLIGQNRLIGWLLGV